MPDYYRGTWVNPITDADKLPAFAKEKTVWNNLKNDWEQKIQPLAEKKGAQYYGTVGKIIWMQFMSVHKYIFTYWVYIVYGF